MTQSDHVAPARGRPGCPRVFAAVLAVVAVAVLSASPTSAAHGTDAVGCLVRAGLDALARSAGPVDLAPGRLWRSLGRTLAQARGKKDKYAGPLLIGAMMVAGTLLPIKLGALAMMSGKALMTSMLALMLSAILALKKLASGGGGGGGGGSTTYEVINVPSPSGHGAHGRSLAHDLAYLPATDA